MTNPNEFPEQQPGEQPFGAQPNPGDPQPGGVPPYGSPQYGAPQPQFGAPQYGAPQYGYQGAPQGPEPDNNLVWSILCTVLCCLPLGIVAIIKSTSVSKLWAQGDYAGAQQAADDAKKFSIWGAGIAVALWLIYVIFIVAVGIGTS